MRLVLLLPLFASATPAMAGELSVLLKTPAGKPVSNAVVSLYPGGKPAAQQGAAGSYRIAQRDLAFRPFVLIVPVGAKVAFPNFDPVRHHVYSFSPTKKFELKLYARDQHHEVRFDKAGVVPLGCNIHDRMTAFVKVADTGLAAKSDPSGKAAFGTVPAGPLVVRIWHPYLRAPGNQIELRWSGSGTRQTQTVTLPLRTPPQVKSSY